MEQDGQLSVFLKKENQPVSVNDFKDSKNLNCNEGICHAIIVDGKINESNLKLCQKNTIWLEKYLSKHNYDIKNIFLFTVNDNNDINIIMKEKGR